MIDFTKNLPRHANRGPLGTHKAANRQSRTRDLLSGLPLGALAYLMLCVGIGTTVFYFFGNAPGLGDLPLWASAVAGLSLLVVLAATAMTGSTSFLTSVLSMAALPAMLRFVTEFLRSAGDVQGPLPAPADALQEVILTCSQWGAAVMVTLMAALLLAGSGSSDVEEDLPDAD